MKRVLLALALLGFGAGMACADINDLSNGVFIAHHNPNMVYSTPLEGWCAYYLNNFAITSCGQQNPSIMGSSVTAPRMWYVLAQWYDPPKTWCATEFGFGDFDPYLFHFNAERGPCAPGGFLEIPTDGWPGPNQGTVVATTDAPWNGNFVPVYYFTGYQYYGSGQMPLSVDPPTSFAGFVNCMTPPTPYPATCLPAMGIGVPGETCCSEAPQTAACCIGEECRVTTQADCAAAGGEWLPQFPNCGPPNPCETPHVCCVGESCYLTTESGCADLQGAWHPDWDSCDNNPCAYVRAVCCLNGDCSITTQQECEALQGEWHQEWTSCEPENPCPPSPADRTTWGSIKSIYR